MSESVSSQPFETLATSLRENGFITQSERISGVLNGTWTTSSELIAELGAAVVAARRECRPLSSPQKALIKQCLYEVRKAWPGFGRFRWWPFR